MTLQIFPEINDEELLRMLKAKNVAAISILYDKYAPAIYGAIRKDIHNVQLAENILQQTFINIWNNPSIESKYINHLLLWMLIVAKRTAIKTPPHIETGTGDEAQVTHPVPAEQHISDSPALHYILQVSNRNPWNL